MTGAVGIEALIHIFLEKAEGDWVAVSDLARLMALADERVVECLRSMQANTPGIDLTLKLDAQDHVIAARLGNGALEAA